MFKIKFQELVALVWIAALIFYALLGFIEGR